MKKDGEVEASRLTEKHCVPYEVGTKPLDIETVQILLQRVSEWKNEGGEKISRSFRFRDFAEAMHFISAVAELANAERHHPDIFVSYNCVKITLTTHSIGGLSENDFIIAAKIDEILGMQEEKTVNEHKDTLAVVSKRLRSDQYARFMGIEITQIERGSAQAELTVVDHMLNFNIITHGGVIFSLADVASAAACNSFNQSSVALSFHIT
jgi:4a-hydroxytetrahydrobiopterin dehydratase